MNTVTVIIKCSHQRQKLLYQSQTSSICNGLLDCDWNTTRANLRVLFSRCNLIYIFLISSTKSNYNDSYNACIILKPRLCLYVNYIGHTCIYVLVRLSHSRSFSGPFNRINRYENILLYHSTLLHKTQTITHHL